MKSRVLNPNTNKRFKKNINQIDNYKFSNPKIDLTWRELRYLYFVLDNLIRNYEQQANKIAKLQIEINQTDYRMIKRIAELLYR